MDFHGMKRKELQNLCRKHGIPANLKNVEMSDRLALIFKEKEDEQNVPGKEYSSEVSFEKDCVEENLVESKETKKVKFSPENEVFEFTRSVKKRPQRNGRTQSKRHVTCFQDARKGVRRSKRNEAKTKVISGDGSETLETKKVDVTEEHKVLRRLKRVASNANVQDGTVGINLDDLSTEGQGQMIEQPPVRSSLIDLEDGSDLMVHQLADKDIAEGLPLGTKVNALQMEVSTRDDSKLETNWRRSTRITAYVKVPNVKGETREVETFFSAKDSKEERKTRRSKRFAASKNTEGEPVENNVKDLLVDSKVQRAEKQPRKNILDVSEVEQVHRRSRRIRESVNMQSAAPEINNNKLTLVDGNTKNGKQKQGLLEVGKAPRLSKRFTANDSVESGALKIDVNEFHIDDQAQKSEQPPKTSSARRSKRTAGDDNAQVGANFNYSDHHEEGQNQVTREQQKGPSDDGPKFEKAVRRSKRLAANEDEQIGGRQINLVEQDMQSKVQAGSKRTRKCTHVGLEAGNNLRRSKRYAGRDDKGAGTSVDGVINPHRDDEVQVPARSSRNSSSQNSREARKEVEENLVGKKTEAAPESLIISPTEAGKMKQDRSGILRVDTEIVSSQSSLTLEELSTEYAQMEPETAGISSGTEVSFTKLTARNSSKKIKIVDQECIKEIPQGLLEDSPSLSVTEVIKPVMSSGITLDPRLQKSAGVSEGRDSQQLSSVRMAREHEKEHEQDGLIQGEINEDTEKTLLSFQFPNESLLVGENDNYSGGQSEVKTGLANSRFDGHLLEETSRQTTSVQLVESKLEAEVDVHCADISPKDIAATVLTNEDIKAKKETSVSTLESDLNEYRGVAEAAAAHMILGELPPEIIKDSVGCWKEIYSSKDDEKGSMEDQQATTLHGNSSESNDENSHAEAQTVIKVGCDTNGGKTSYEITVEPMTCALEEKTAISNEEVFDVTSSGKCGDFVDLTFERKRKRSLVEQTNLSVDVGLEDTQEACCNLSVIHGNVAQTAEDQDATSWTTLIDKETENIKERTPESMEKHHAPTETSIHEIEETDLQAKVSGSMACEDIHDNVLISDKTKEIAGNGVVLVSSTDKRRDEDSRDKDVVVARNLINSEVLTEEEEKKALSGLVSFGHCENLQTLAKVKDDALKKYEEANSSDRGYKQEVSDLSRCPSTNLAFPVFKEEEAPKIVEEESTNVTVQPISRNEAARFQDESFTFTTPERNLMLREQLDETGKTFGAESVTHYNNEAKESPDEPVVFTSLERHLLLGDSGLDEPGNKGENKGNKLHDEPNIFTTLERHLMLGGFGPNEGEKQGENTSAEFHDEPTIGTSPELYSSSGYSKHDGAWKSEENKDVEFHGVSGNFSVLERHLLLGDLELVVAETGKENKVEEFHGESVGFADAGRHNLLGDSEQDETGKNEEKEDSEFNHKPGLFTGLERHILSGDPEQDEAGKEGERITAKSHDEFALFTSPERDLLFGDSGLQEAGKRGENAAQEAGKRGENAALKIHGESVVTSIMERHPRPGDSELDESGKCEVSKSVEIHGECAIFTSPERHLLSGNYELDEGKKEDNTAVKPLDMSAIFTSPERHLLSEDSKPDEAGICKENNVVELHGGSSIFTSPERHLLFGHSGVRAIENKRENTTAKFHEVCAVFSSPVRHLLLGDSESDEARKSDQNKDMELGNESVSVTRLEDRLFLGVSAQVSHDEPTISTSAERHLMLADSDMEEFGNKGERSQADVLNKSKGNGVIIGEAEQTTLDLEVEKDHHDNNKNDLTQSQSHSAFSFKAMPKENSLVTRGLDTVLATSESSNIDSNGLILCSHKPDAVQEAARREVLLRDIEVEDIAGLNNMQDTSNGSQGHVPQVDSVNHADLAGDRAETIMEVETNICLDLQVFALKTNDTETESGEASLSVGDFSHHPEVGGTNSMINLSSNLLVCEESRPSIHGQDLRNDSDEELMITGEDTDKKRADELIEITTEEGKSPTEIAHQSEKYKDYDGILLSSSTGSHASEETYVLTGKEDEHSGIDSEDSLNGEATAPTVTEKNLPEFALQSETHDSTDKNIPPAEPAFQNNINEQEEKITTRETTPIAQETPARSSKSVNKDPGMDVTNTLLKRQFSCLKRGVSREPSFICGTQLKPVRHDMKENATSSKIAQTLNVTAPRTSKRQPLKDLGKN